MGLQKLNLLNRTIVFRSSWNECDLPDFCHEKMVLRLGLEADLKVTLGLKKTPDNDNLTGSSQRLTTAWWEEDEIECVWLGEGRIEHKPALRKITIYSRWLQRFPYIQ